MTLIDIVKEHKCIWKGVYINHEESTCYSLSCGREYFDNYMCEDGERFKTLDEAKECLIAEFNEYVARNLDEVQDV